MPAASFAKPKPSPSLPKEAAMRSTISVAQFVTLRLSSVLAVLVVLDAVIQRGVA